jgi:hypothetical protein
VLIGEQEATVAEMAVAMVTAAMRGAEVEPRIHVEALVESGRQVEMELARAIDLGVREIAAAEIELAVATWEAVLGIEAASEMVADTAAAVRVQAVVEVLPAWVVRGAGAPAERAVGVVAVVAVVGGGSEVIREPSPTPNPRL